MPSPHTEQGWSGDGFSSQAKFKAFKIERDNSISMAKIGSQLHLDSFFNEMNLMPWKSLRISASQGTSALRLSTLLLENTFQYHENISHFSHYPLSISIIHSPLYSINYSIHRLPTIYDPL